MAQYTGQCVGGPDDGKQMTHWSKSKEYLSPLPTFSMDEDADVQTVKVGEYRLNDFGQWHWHETAEGKAVRTLHDNR